EFDFAREAAFITGPTIVGSALKRPSVDKLETVKGRGGEAVDWAARQIHVEFPAPNLLRIRHVGERSREAARLVNAIASAYVDEMEVRITAELAKLQSAPPRAAVELRRPATY